ncbi:MAG: aminopeptidase N [Pseudoxanthomonas sp.]
MSPMFRTGAVALFALSLTGTQALANPATPTAPTAPAASQAQLMPQARAANPYLSQEDAAARAARISNLAYALDMRLTGEPRFSSNTRISFDLSDAATALTVDLDKATISKLVVNGHALQPDYNNWFITLPASSLRKGHNTVTVDYSREHSTSGEGLHRYVDKADGRVYLYTHFEPAAAHQMFPSFDQPDPKATYTLTATAPKDWYVISSTPETRVEDQGATRRWIFPTTPRLSAYNFSMHAGPYRMWQDTSGPIPMRLFVRQSVSDQVVPAEWFRITKAGLAYYDDYFGIPYPFKKYDQILVPQFIYGAMENAAAITFTETRFLSDKPMTSERSRYMAAVILHEMAHQWFGDLVTMRWWNGLWLNESFASYMQTLASSKSPGAEATWPAFFQSKQGAYEKDSSITTHPVEVPVASTANAFDNIDSITYNKGASVLHQLRKMIGDEVFQRGVHNYLVAHAYGNATLDDFIGAMSDASGRDLRPWAQEWLYLPGVDKLSADFACSAGKVSRFQLLQSPANTANPTLRTQRVQVALFNATDGKLALSAKQVVDYAGASTQVPAFVGAACPDLVYPNYEDWGFVKVVLDPASFATARTHLSQVDDSMLRSMLWRSLIDGRNDGTLALQDFIGAVLENLPREPDTALLSQALDALNSARSSLRIFGGTEAAVLSDRIEGTLWTGLLADAGDRDRGTDWFDTYVDAAGSKASLEKLRGILDGRVAVAGMEISQEQRWKIVRQLNRFDAPGSAALIAIELERDKSERGQLAALGATVIRPDPATKLAWLDKLQAMDGSEPFSRLRVVMGSLYPEGQGALAEASAAQRLASLPQIEAKADPVFLRTYVSTMIPTACTPASVTRLQQAIDASGALSPSSQRALQSKHESDQRCVNIRAKYEASAGSR